MVMLLQLMMENLGNDTSSAYASLNDSRKNYPFTHAGNSLCTAGRSAAYGGCCPFNSLW